MKFSDAKIFDFNGKELNVFLDEKENIWFYGIQVAEILEYVNPRDNISKLKGKYKLTMSKKSFKDSMGDINSSNLLLFMGDKEKVNDENKDVTSLLWNKTNDNTNKTLISEAGFYRLIFGSKLKEAEKFTDWVVEDVLPSIRKTGKYKKQEDTTPVVQDNTLADLTKFKEDIKEYLNVLASNQAAIGETINKVGNVLFEESNKTQEFINKTDNVVGRTLSTLLHSQNNFYKNKDYGANYDNAHFYRASELAIQFNIDNEYLYELLVNNGFLQTNPGKHAPFKDLKYFPTNACLKTGIAVMMPYGDQENYPNKYFYRFSEYGKKYLYNYLKYNGVINDNNGFFYNLNR